ncbi:MAG: diiron oxygenase [Gammaproteobacteria bacterium]|nr:diiron oxygenase [Gammaproteobacteria bacterium]
MSLHEQLSRSSTPYEDPLESIRWNELKNNQFWLPEEAISLFGTPEYEKLTSDQKQRLSQVEFINFIEAGLWLESLFMERIGRSVRQDRTHLSELTYHLHELREEAGHSLMFLELIKLSQLNVPNKHFNRLNVANLFAKFAPFNSAMFWVAVLVGEEVPDRMNRYIRKNRDSVCPPIADIVGIHIHDEARHIAHAKSMINNKLNGFSNFKSKLVSTLINKMFNDFVQAYYYPPTAIYIAAGLGRSVNWQAISQKNQHRQEFVKNSIRPTLETINAQGVNLNWGISNQS